MITYDSWNPLLETDYYQSDPESEKGKYTSVWSIYDFKQNTLEYFTQVPLKEPIIFEENGWVVKKVSEEKKLSKEEFTTYINEMNKDL